MSIYTFKVPNSQLCTITVEAENEEEAKQKMKEFDIIEEVVNDDYHFDEAVLDKVEE